ncbi:cysteine proteinase 1, mitochondrial [Trichomonascus vanleenenianus]|uniref:bleomycin hydrolase n=1 Tax=Trichomonascus vanleenenianus TaxID=2268995 RepID=UPI003EC99270
MSLPIDSLNTWTASYENDLTVQLASTVLQNQDPTKALLNRQDIINTPHVFNTSVENEGSPITNQKSSGRCWIFAATNLFRVPIMKKYNLSELQLSQTYLFFYDKLEKANYFLDQIIQTAGEEIDSRLVQHLLTDPVQDGGQFDMIVTLVEKYGLVPQDLYPDAWSSTSSARANFVLTTMLRDYAEKLRDAIKAGKDANALRVEFMQEIHRMLVLFFGAPPGVDQEFTWHYTDKDKKYGSLKTTPLKFYQDHIEDLKNTVSVVNDPRNEYNRMIKVDRLGNVVGGVRDVTYLNASIDDVAQHAIDKIKANEPVFFGSHTPLYMDKTTGVFSLDVWDYKLVGFKPDQNKAKRLEYHQSLMTHAMVLTGVHLEDDKPVRWRVQNSWGEDNGKKGFYVMTHDYFKEYVYQIVTEKDKLSSEVAKALDDKHPIVLPPWDPMGALAN